MEWYEILFKLALSILFGLIIGLERERRHRPAGIKTHIMVCMGAAVVSMIQLEMTEHALQRALDDPAIAQVIKVDYGRLGAQVISGIGFLGAGTILRSKGSIKGLTTASTLWVIACVGLAVGMGYYYISAMAVGGIAVVLIVLRFIQNMIQARQGIKRINVTMENKHDAMKFIHNYCVKLDIEINNVRLLDSSEKDMASIPDGRLLTFEYEIYLPRTVTLKHIISDFLMENSIRNISEATEDLSD